MAIPFAASSASMRWGVVVPGSALLLASWAALALAPTAHELPQFAVMWVTMTFAMMVPTVTRPMMRAADGSPARAWLFTFGFLVVWLAAGVPAYLLMAAVEWTPFWIALAWLVAGAYQITPAMQRLLSTCRSVAFRGDPVRYGVQQGLRCVGSCAPVMLAVMVTAMALPAAVLGLGLLVGVTVLLCWEKSRAARPRAIAAVGLVMLLSAAGSFVVLGGGGSAHSHSTGVSTS